MKPSRTDRDSDLYTADEFYALVPDGQKADLIDGVVYRSSPDTLENDDLTGFVNFLLRGFAEARGLGRVQGSRYAFVLREDRAPEPDVAFVSAARLRILTRRGGTAAPDIGVEVVSRDSQSRDYVEKMRLYEEAGVQEYWLLNPRQGRHEFLRLAEGRYAPVPLVRNRYFLSTALPDFWLDVEWLMQSPLPNAFECLQRLLAGPPEPPAIRAAPPEPAAGEAPPAAPPGPAGARDP